MNEVINHSELHRGSRKSMAMMVIARHTLTRTCILGILKREFPEFEICELATIGELNGASGTDVRLIVLDIGDNPIADAFVEDQFAALGRFFPHAPVALLCARDKEAPAAMRRGARGFFPLSIPIEVAVAGLRLVLAGGVYWPLPIDAGPNEPPCIDSTSASRVANEASVIPDAVAVETERTPYTMIDLTPRERHVLAALELGLPNKLIAARLNLSENTVKMHMRHIMQKCSARNRTEAVIFCSGRLSRTNDYARIRASSSS
jgi:DNA-binding NarL/FixJ family response regulator